jgi:hypothetical protein
MKCSTCMLYTGIYVERVKLLCNIYCIRHCQGKESQMLVQWTVCLSNLNTHLPWRYSILINLLQNKLFVVTSVHALALKCNCCRTVLHRKPFCELICHPLKWGIRFCSETTLSLVPLPWASSMLTLPLNDQTQSCLPCIPSQTWLNSCSCLVLHGCWLYILPHTVVPARC